MTSSTAAPSVTMSGAGAATSSARRNTWAGSSSARNERSPRRHLQHPQMLRARPARAARPHRRTGRRARRAQAPRRVSDEIARRTGLSGPRMIAGDFNEWTLGLTTRLLRREFRSADLERFTGLRRTSPGILPLLHLDHIYYDHHLRLVDFAVHRSRKALLASDHLPLVADFALA